MPTHSETKLLPYSAQQMYDLVADVRRYPEFLPWTAAARIRSNEDRGDHRVDRTFYTLRTSRKLPAAGLRGHHYQHHQSISVHPNLGGNTSPIHPGFRPVE